MEFISVFDMLKIGVGPSSSHTLGPWRAAQQFLAELHKKELFAKTKSVSVDLYGSLSLTGKGHATDLAIVLGLSGTDPEFIPIEDIDKVIQKVKTDQQLHLDSQKLVPFLFEKEIVFHKKFLPFHANGLTFKAHLDDGSQYNSTFYSIGGGFVVKEEQEKAIGTEIDKKNVPYPNENAVVGLFSPFELPCQYLQSE